MELAFDKKLYSQYVYVALQETFDEAERFRKEFVTPEHFLYNLSIQEKFVKSAKDIGVDLTELHNELRKYIDGLDVVEEGDDIYALPSENLSRLITSLESSVYSEDDFVYVYHVFDAIVDLDSTLAAYLLNTTFDSLIHEMINALYKNYSDEMKFSEFSEMISDDIEHVSPQYVLSTGENVKDMSADEIFNKMMSSANRLMSALGSLHQSSSRDGEEVQSVPREPWEDFLVCISDTYKYHNPLVGRENELERTIQILCRKDKNNPLYIGEAGVGKTALIYGLAEKIDKGNVPEALQGFRIYSMDMATIVAGSSYHGEMEKRLKDIMEGLKNRGKCILYIDEIHSIMSSGNNGKGAVDVADILKPYLEDGSIRFIGSTTYQEYNRSMANNKGIVRRFQQIDVFEPSVEETVKILEGLKASYEKHHHVRYDSEAIQYAIKESDRLIADRFLPDKAIDIIDEAGAYRQIHPLKNKKGEKMSEGRQKVDKHLIAEILAKICKINAKALTEDDNAQLRDLDKRISNAIYGQDEAIDKVVRAVKMSKAGLTFGDKPLASLLFVGPTGVGKTEVCKVLAKELGIELVRFDMSEYTEKHAVAKLIGSPAGYVGYDDGGLLTDAIRKSPNCVLLLDEIEKAHDDIYNILLQVMDYAKLTDNKGNKVDFKNVILIMTSNAGAQYAGLASIGFGGGSTKGEAMMQSVKKIFKPEFINRLSGTVVFRDMDEKMASLILDKKVRELSSLLKAKNVTMALSDDARQLLMDKGFTKQYGAREMDRSIQNLLTPILMDEILFGKLKNGGEAQVERDGDKLKLA